MLRSALAGCVLLLASCASAPREMASSSAAPSGSRIGTATAVLTFSRDQVLDYCDSRPTEAVLDSVVVSPSRLELRVGDVVLLATLTTTAASSGAFVPVRYDVDSESVKLEDAGLRAIAAGAAELRVRPMCATMRTPNGAIPVTMVPVLIQP